MSITITFNAATHEELVSAILQHAALFSKTQDNSDKQTAPTQMAAPSYSVPAAPQTPPPATPAPVPPVVPTAAAPIPVPPVVPTAAAPVPVPPMVPTTAAPTYSHEQIMNAGAALIDAGKMNELMGLLNAFGVPAVTQLKQEQLGAFATELRKLGAQI